MTVRHRCNVEYLAREFPLAGLEIRADDVPPGKISVMSVEKHG